MANGNRADLSVSFLGSAEILAQESHLAHGCLFVPMPSPAPLPFAEVAVHLTSPWNDGGAAIVAHGSVVQIVEGRGIAVALSDAAAAKQKLAPTFAKARGEASPVDGATSVAWGIVAPAPAGAGPSAPAESAASETPENDEAATSGALFDRIAAMSAQEKMQLAVHGDRAARLILVRDINKSIQQFVLQNKRITIDEVRYIAGFRQAHPEVLNTIAGNRDWVGNPSILAALVRNPKTPTPVAVKLLDKLPMAEIRRIAKSDEVPRAIVVAARKKAVDA